MDVTQKIICHECRNFVTYCFCFCPYCGGNDSRRCQCTTEPKVHHSIVKGTRLTFTKKMLRDRLDWTRLEKWQIGRRNFP